ncbi:MAG: RHS repeat-associated core domain-containing protein [Planctomycetia bacterium]|nr:RHS repeat-associated core domain-containing protein [Planctomycetia bacterium]
MLAATDDFEVRFAYDGLNHQIVDKRDGLGIEHRYSDDHLVETNVFDAFQTTYRRMPDGVLVIRDPSGAEHRLAVLDGGLVVRTMFNGSTEVTQHDSFGRCLVKSLRSGESGARNWYRVYEYSGEGDLVSATDSRTGTIAFEYDKAHRLVSAIAASGQPQRFDYDRADNLLRQPGLVGAGVAQGNRLVAANGDRFSFNGRDHVSERRGPNGVTRFAYNSHDMLVQVQSDTLQWEARYDPLARRISKSWNGRRVEYYWDGDKLSAEVRHDGSLRIYIYADQLSLVPLLFVEYASIDADPASGRRYYVFTNQIGAPLLVEDDRGQKVWAANIEPYGRTAIDRESTIDFPLRFPGHYWDAEIGLQYNRYRYYSPELGRYIQADPIGLGGGLNVYAYPTGPLTSVDVLGLAQCPKPPKPIDEMTDAELQKWLATLTPAQLRALKDSNPRDFNKDSDGSRIRYADYKNNGGTKSFADWSQGNKGGRGGGPGHQAVQDKLEKKGAQTEVPFGNRAADAYEPPKDGKPGVIHQIGGLNKRGDPISRERDAINDIMNSPEYKNQDPKPTIVFHDKNPPHKKVTNPQDKPNWNGGDSDDDE